MEKVLKMAVVAGVLGVLCAAMFSRLKTWRGPEDNLLPCPPAKPSQPCIADSQLKPAQIVAQVIRDHAHKRAELYDCGDTSVDTRSVTLAELKPLLPECEDMSDVLSLIISNPHWQIKWMDSDGSTVTQWTHRPSNADAIESTQTAVPLSCQVSLVAMAMWGRMKLVLLVLLVVVVIAAIVQWYISSRRQDDQATFTMVHRIMEVLRHHHEKCQRKKDLIPYLAIIHVRDILIPPSERERKRRVWEKACRWIAEHESRVRVEVQRIAGEDLPVWRWTQEDPPPTEEPSATSGQTRRSRGANWGGRTFEDYPSIVEDRIAPPLGTPSPCVRLKNMFEAVKRMDADQVSELENAVLDRCIPYGSVVHVYVDKRSTFGCVYFKMDSISSATGAYKALHGVWYKGKLVTAKYIPEAKYHKWFPKASTAKYPILPSS